MHPITAIANIIKSYVHNKLVFSPSFCGRPRRKKRRTPSDVSATGPPLVIKGQGCKRRDFYGHEPLIDILC